MKINQLTPSVTSVTVSPFDFGRLLLLLEPFNRLLKLVLLLLLFLFTTAYKLLMEFVSFCGKIGLELDDSDFLFSSDCRSWK